MLILQFTFTRVYQRNIRRKLCPHVWTMSEWCTMWYSNRCMSIRMCGWMVWHHVWYK